MCKNGKKDDAIKYITNNKSDIIRTGGHSSEKQKPDEKQKIGEEFYKELCDFVNNY